MGYLIYSVKIGLFLVNSKRASIQLTRNECLHKYPQIYFLASYSSINISKDNRVGNSRHASEQREIRALQNKWFSLIVVFDFPVRCLYNSNYSENVYSKQIESINIREIDIYQYQAQQILSNSNAQPQLSIQHKYCQVNYFQQYNLFGKHQRLYKKHQLKRQIQGKSDNLFRMSTSKKQNQPQYLLNSQPIFFDHSHLRMQKQKEKENRLENTLKSSSSLQLRQSSYKLKRGILTESQQKQVMRDSMMNNFQSHSNFTSITNRIFKKSRKNQSSKKKSYHSIEKKKPINLQKLEYSPSQSNKQRSGSQLIKIKDQIRTHNLRQKGFKPFNLEKIPIRQQNRIIIDKLFQLSLKLQENSQGQIRFQFQQSLLQKLSANLISTLQTTIKESLKIDAFFPQLQETGNLCNSNVAFLKVPLPNSGLNSQENSFYYGLKQLRETHKFGIEEKKHQQSQQLSNYKCSYNFNQVSFPKEFQRSSSSFENSPRSSSGVTVYQIERQSRRQFTESAQKYLGKTLQFNYQDKIKQHHKVDDFQPYSPSTQQTPFKRKTTLNEQNFVQRNQEQASIQFQRTFQAIEADSISQHQAHIKTQSKKPLSFKIKWQSQSHQKIKPQDSLPQSNLHSKQHSPSNQPSLSDSKQDLQFQMQSLQNNHSEKENCSQKKAVLFSIVNMLNNKYHKQVKFNTQKSTGKDHSQGNFRY